MLCALAGRGYAAEAESSTLVTSPAIQDTNLQQLTQVLLQLQGELHSNRLSFQQMDLEARLTAARNAQVLSNALDSLERTFSAQQELFAGRTAKELEVMERSHRVMLTAACFFVGMSAVALLLMAYFQWRTSRTWAQMSSRMQLGRSSGQGTPGGLLGENSAEPGAAVEEANQRLLGAVEQLERRVRGLERRTELPLKGNPGGVSAGGNGEPTGGSNGPQAGSVEHAGDEASAPALLKNGLAKLKANELDAALTCFEEALRRDPGMNEALVRKGVTLERMHRLNEAFECYDRAIKADGAMTLAYLCKGGLCSRLERFKEALECYEQALKTHEEERD